MADRGDQVESNVDSDIVQLLQTLGATPVIVESRSANGGPGFDVVIRVIGPFAGSMSADAMAEHIAQQLALLGVPVA